MRQALITLMLVQILGCLGEALHPEALTNPEGASKDDIQTLVSPHYPSHTPTKPHDTQTKAQDPHLVPGPSEDRCRFRNCQN